jgi:hypothetical protein
MTRLATIAFSLVLALGSGAVHQAVVAQPAAYRGFAAHYKPGLMEYVARKRGLPTGGCLAASPYHRIGTRVSVESLTRGTALTCLIVDVPHPRDRAQVIRRGIIIELDYRSNGVLCYHREPPRKCRVAVQ